jgi:hypothetical protein
MNLLHSYIDQQMIISKLGQQRQFFSNNQDTMMRGGGLSNGGGVPQERNSGLDSGGFHKQKPFVKQAVAESGNENKSEEEKKSSGESEVVTIRGTSGSSSSSSSSSRAPMDTTSLEEKSPQPSGDHPKFSKYIPDYLTPFKNSRTRKSPVFVADDKGVGLMAWKSLRSAGLSSKKVGKLKHSGVSIPFTHDTHKGRMYFLSDSALKSLKRKKHVTFK